MSYLLKTALSAVALLGSQASAQALPQVKTNGASTLGLLNTPALKAFVDGPVLPGGFPWGHKNVVNANPYIAAPLSGQVRVFNWEITNTTLAPDGVQIPMLVVNGQFPGPLIEANWGDEIIIHVKNKIDEPTAIHMHGFLQTDRPYMDGVPGTTQCPIPPGKTFTYKVRAELYGTSWWHSHYSSQYIAGLVGPIVIHGPTSRPYDIDLGPVMLQDHYHGYYKNLVQQIFYATPGGAIRPPKANSILINGKANFNCSTTSLPCTPGAGTSKFRFQKGKRHLLRLINSGGEAILFFSIDGYNMTVIANDFVALEPYQTNVIALGIGQRADIIVVGKGKATDSVLMRVNAGPSGDNAAGQAPLGEAGCGLISATGNVTTAAIYYQNANTAIPPNTTSHLNIPQRFLFPTACANDNLQDTRPAYPIAVTEPSVTHTIHVSARYNETGAFRWYMDNVTIQNDFNDPTLLEAKLGETNFARSRAVYNYPNATSIRVILVADNFPTWHPMHLHGHNFLVLAEGSGTWDGKIVRPKNPQRRDTHIWRPRSYVVLQWDLDNPGLWPFHCHIAWHISEGMGINVMDQQNTLINKVKFPNSVAQTCRDWASWAGENVVHEIDSGL